MDRTETILNLAAAMGINVQKELQKNQYNASTGTYYCNQTIKKPLLGMKRS